MIFFQVHSINGKTRLTKDLDAICSDSPDWISIVISQFYFFI